MTGSRGPLAILTSCSQSHAFDERRVVVPCSEEDALKIGRSVARWKPSPDNAIFDCKVLSRNHAILWFEEGQFFLKDTKSSNGTFVNSERLSKSAEESSPRQIYSGDIVQFGVEIVENANKVTHGCIIAMVRLFDAKGDEVCTPEIIGTRAGDFTETSAVALLPIVNNHQLFQLQQYVREASHRERSLENKVGALESVLFTTEKATENSWQALINEDRLLSRIEMLEGQLALYSKNVLTDKVKIEMSEMLADKNKFETLAKEALRRAQEEKCEALQRLTDVERCLVTTEEETTGMRQRIAEMQEELAAAVALNAQLNETLSQTQHQLRTTQANYESACSANLELQQQPISIPNGSEVADQHIVLCTNGGIEDVPLINEKNNDGKRLGYDPKEEISFLRTELMTSSDENVQLKEQLAKCEERIAELMISNAVASCNEMSPVICDRDADTSILFLCVLPLFALFYFVCELVSRLAALRPKSD